MSESFFSENFEEGDLDVLKKRWHEAKNPKSQVLELVDDQAVPGVGKRSLKMTATFGVNDGGYLYKRFDKSYDKLFYRFYVKFADDAAYIHHFVHLGGYNPATTWPQGGAGERAGGDERITVGIEPYGRNGKFKAPGVWNFYPYWHEMKASVGNKYCGNSISLENPPLIPRGKWQCVEAMIKLNTSPEKADGQLTLWVDGEESMDVKKGTPRSKWTGMGFILPEKGGEPFEGFRFRKSNDLKLNFFWLLHYVTENAARQNRDDSPNRTNSVWFDDIVVATEYIGPIKLK